MKIIGTAILFLAGVLMASAGILVALGGSPLGDNGFEWKRFAAGSLLFALGMAIGPRKRIHVATCRGLQ